jgi:hypothetical protein
MTLLSVRLPQLEKTAEILSFSSRKQVGFGGVRLKSGRFWANLHTKPGRFWARYCGKPGELWALKPGRFWANQRSQEGFGQIHT